MNNSKGLNFWKKLVIGIVALLGIGGGATLLGGTPGNLPSNIATSSIVELGTDSVDVVFATTSAPSLCASRTITTFADPILLAQFTKGTNATASLQNLFGHMQLASTTVSYPAEDWGCGAWVGTAISQGSTTIMITEYRQ